MKWLVRAVLTYLLIVVMTFVWGFAVARYPALRSVHRTVFTPVVGFALNDQIYTSDVSYADRNVYDFKWLSETTNADLSQLDIIVLPLERWADIRSLPIARALGVAIDNEEELPSEGSITRTRRIAIVGEWSWLPLKVRRQEVVIFEFEPQTASYREECVAEFLARIAVDRIDEEFRLRCAID